MRNAKRVSSYDPDAAFQRSYHELLFSRHQHDTPITNSLTVRGHLLAKHQERICMPRRRTREAKMDGVMPHICGRSPRPCGRAPHAFWSSPSPWNGTDHRLVTFGHASQAKASGPFRQPREEPKARAAAVDDESTIIKS